MISSSSSSRGSARTRSGWKAATLPRTPIATRTDDDARAGLTSTTLWLILLLGAYLQYLPRVSRQLGRPRVK